MGTEEQDTRTHCYILNSVPQLRHTPVFRQTPVRRQLGLLTATVTTAPLGSCLPGTSAYWGGWEEPPSPHTSHMRSRHDALKHRCGVQSCGPWEESTGHPWSRAEPTSSETKLSGAETSHLSTPLSVHLSNGPFICPSVPPIHPSIRPSILHELYILPLSLQLSGGNSAESALVWVRYPVLQGPLLSTIVPKSPPVS